jgi:hypothetical protein
MLAQPHSNDLVASPSEPTPAAGHRWALLVSFCAAIASMAVYRAVLGAYFWNDDFAWLYLLRDRSLVEFLFTPIGGHSLVARNALFALIDVLAGFDPRPYFAIMLLTHAFNVALLAGLIWRLTDRPILAGIGALAWGTCPAASETLSWYSVYGQVAATTCILLALHRVAARAQDPDRFSLRDITITAAWLVLSSIFFGTAIAVACVWPLAIALLLPSSLADPRRRAGILSVSAAVLGLYVLLEVVASCTYDVPLNPVGALKWLLASPTPAIISFLQLLRVGAASLVMGAWWRPAVGSDPLSWVALLVTGCGSLGALAVAPSRQRRTMVAFGLLALAVYALVAVARGPGSVMFLGMTGASVGATPRYHYAAQAFVIVALCAGIAGVASRLRSRAIGGLGVAWACVLVAGLIVHGVPVDRHDAVRTEVTGSLRALRAQAAQARPGETIYIDNAPVQGFGWMPNTVQPPPGLAALFIIAFRDDDIDGRPVRFVELRPALSEPFVRRGSRTARLLVSAPPSAASRAGVP